MSGSDSSWIQEQIPRWSKAVEELERANLPPPPPPPPPIDPPRRGGDDGEMEARLAKLEADIGVIKATHATREDVQRVSTEVHKAVNDQTWKLITWTTGLGAALVAAAFFIAQKLN